MKVGQKIYIIDRNKRHYDNHKLIEEKMIREVEIVRESNQSFFINISGKEYRYSKKNELLVSNTSQELYGIQSKIFDKKEDAILSLKPKIEKTKNDISRKKYTLINCKDGTQMKLEHRYLDQDFIDKAIEWAKENNVHPQSESTSSYFVAQSIEKYIEETAEKPIYE